MHILVAASEAVPFADAGGLANVCTSLVRAYSQLGHTVSIFLPAYSETRASGQQFEPADIELAISIGSKTVKGSVLRGVLPGTDAEVFLVQQDDYFNRAGLYGEGGKDYKDNCERFAFFCRAVMQAIPQLATEVDVIHAHDWPTGLIPACLATEYRHLPGYGQIVSVFTVHDVSLQGNFWHWDMLLTGLDWKYFNWRQMEFFGQLSLLKTGLVFADALTTVSAQYAREIQTSPAGCGLEGVFRERRTVLTGIWNGIDCAKWDPSSDKHLPADFSAEDISGKSVCKAALQRELGLTVSAEEPLVALVGPFSTPEAIDLAATVVGQWCQSVPVQWVVAPADSHRQQFAEHARQCPQRVAVATTEDEGLLHRILAACDILLIPDRKGPSGQSHLCAMRYGAIPVARGLGDLVDTIHDATTASDEPPTGYLFSQSNLPSLAHALHQACTCFREQQKVWNSMVRSAMMQDVSWRRTARSYLEVFSQTLAQHRQPVTA